MYRFIGYLLIIVASGGIGISFSQDMQKHLDELEEIKRIFYLLRSELQYTKAPFAEVFEVIGKKSAGIYGEWLIKLSECLRKKGNGSFWKLWCLSIDENLKTSALKKQELEELKHVGKNLEYMESLDLYIEQIEYKIKNTRETYQSKKKLCRSMGIICGVFLVILLV